MKTTTTFKFDSEYIIRNKKELLDINSKKRSLDFQKIKMPLPRINNPIIDSCLMDF